jgi:serine/threonine protein kinase
MSTPSLPENRWLRAKVVFEAAVGLPGDARRLFLDKACASDPDLRVEVQSLLDSHDQVEGFLSTPVMAEGMRLLAKDDDGLEGRLIGPYRVLRQIGRGGMGAVYEAVRADDNFEKRVAIKVVKRGMDTDFILTRFRGERQILAGLDHPNIARLLDGGTTEAGLPYFVMEHIEGQPIHEYAESRNLKVRERLELFRAVCGAVHYAHQNLIVHRDIKPTNILVTAAGVPKLLDFGIAKILNPAGFPETIAPTALGQRLMTPDFASPEQVRGEPITTASDIYSLGVLLYELLAGRRPYHLRSLEPEELIRVICETEPPPPSEAVMMPLPHHPPSSNDVTSSPFDLTMTLQPLDTALLRPEKRRRELQGDLDNIVMMALRKEARRRYASADQFSEDIRRHLVGLPVSARKDTLFYRTGKFVRRHRTVVAAGLLSLAALTAGVVGTLWQAREARVARARAERRFADVRRLANSFLFEFHDAIETLPGSTKARELVVRRALEYLDSLATEADDPTLRRELAEAYRRVGDVQGNPYFANLGDTEGALASYRKALALDEVAARENPTVPNRLDVSTDHNKIGDLQLQMGDKAGALASHRLALEEAEAVHGADPAALPALRRVFVAHTKVGEALSDAGDLGGAQASFERALAAAEKQLAADPGTPRTRRDLTVALINIGDVRSDAGDKRGALAAFDRALVVRDELLRASPSDTRTRYDMAALLERVGTVQAALGDVEAALATQRRGLEVISGVAAADPANVGARRGMAISHASVGQLLGRLSRHAEAEKELREAIRIRERLVEDDATNALVRTELAESHVFLAEALRAAGRGPDSCRALRSAAGLYGALETAGQLPASHQAEPGRVKGMLLGC